MDNFRSKMMDLNGGYVNYESPVKVLLKQAVLKATIPVRSMIEFFAEQGQPLKSSETDRSVISNKREITPAKYFDSKMSLAFNTMARKKVAKQENISNSTRKKLIDLPENDPDISPAQIVFAVIHNQQVEWMNDTERESE